MQLGVEQIWISPGHDFKGRHGKGRLHHEVLAVDSVECHAGRGLVGDRYYDFKPDFKGQITLLNAEVVDALATHFGLESLDATVLRRNVLVRGTPVEELVGKAFKLSGVVLEGVEEAAPCYWMDEAICEGACDWLEGRGGLRCKITKSGMLSCDIK